MVLIIWFKSNCSQESEKGSLPWKIDPCGDKSVQEYWKIFEGNLNIFWLHQTNHPRFAITLSKVERGQACASESMHTCSKFE